MAINKAGKFVTSAAAGLAALGSLFGAAHDVAAQDATVQNVAVTAPGTNELSPGIRAARWANQHPDAVSVYISVGTHETSSLDQFKTGVEQLIEKNYPIDAEIFVEKADKAATIIIVRHNGVTEEPTPIQNLKIEMEKVMNTKKLLSQLHEPTNDAG